MTFIPGIFIVLAAFGVGVTLFVAVFSGLSCILDFAMQDALSDLASGLMIMIPEPFDNDDHIKASGTSGVVDETPVASTQIRTFDHQIIVVPNFKTWSDVITQISVASERQVDLSLVPSHHQDRSQNGPSSCVQRRDSGVETTVLFDFLVIYAWLR